jgi:hypothetical protein
VARGAVITGTVADLNGRPAQNVRISLLQYRMNLGERQLVNAPISGPALTDDRGVYRVYGLLPGEYILGAVPVALDALPIGTSDVQWAQQQIRQSQTEPAPSASRPSPAPQPAAMPQAVQYARVFYPGTPDPSGALAITLKAGEERAGVDFVLQYVPSAHVEGTVVGPDGRPRSRPQITVTQPGVPGNVSIGVNWDEANGRFTINGLPPGQYRLTARSNMMPAPVGPLPSAAGSLSSLWGMTDLTLTGTDVSGVTIALRPSLTMTGRMNFESTSQPPEDASNVRILVAPVTNADAGAPAMGTGASDGTFSLPGIVPGRHRLSATGPTLARIGGPPATWLLMSAILNGRDISDRPFDVAPEDSLQNVVLTWSDQPAEISGKLLDASGLPVTDYTVVLFTTDRTFWGLQSRRTLRFPPGPEGQFHFQGLLPGEYYISAVTAVEPEDFADPAFFEQLVNASIKITVTAGEKKVQELRLAGGGN